MKDKRESLGPCIIGEHLLMSVILGAIAERFPPSDPNRARMEGWAKENIPLLLKEGNKSGDLLGVIKNYHDNLEALWSQKKADYDLGERAMGIKANKLAIKNALAAGDEKKALEARVFFLLKWKCWRDLKHPDVQRLIELAKLTGDDRLLIRLGRALAEIPKQGYEDLAVDPVEFVLIEWWVKGPRGEIGLCRLTDQALADFCNLALRRYDLTLDSVRKTRQRLKLKKGAKPWYNKIEKRQTGIAICLD